MAKRKLSSSYVRKREDIKTAVTKRAAEKILIAGFGPGYRTGGTKKAGTTTIIGSPTGTKVKTLNNGQEITVAKRKAKNPNSTPKTSKMLGAKGRTRVVTQVIPKPFQSYSNKAKPIAGKGKPVLASEMEKRRMRTRTRKTK